MEPETPWKNKAKLLCEKNQHGIDIVRIKIMMDNFQKNVNLEKLIVECKNELNGKNKSKTIPTKPKPKSSGLFDEFNGFLTGNLDWSQINEIKVDDKSNVKNNPESKTDIEIPTISKESQHLLWDKNVTQDSMSKSFNNIDNEQYEIDDSKYLLSQMFPDVDEEILVDLLITYQNDVDTVTNILLDSVNLNDFAKDSVKKIEEEKSITKKIDTLKNLCTKALDKLEIELEKHYEKKESISLDDTDNSNELNVVDDSKDQKVEEGLTNINSEKKSEKKLEKNRKLANNIIKQETKWDAYKKSLVNNKKVQKKNKNQFEKIISKNFDEEEAEEVIDEENEEVIDDSVLSLNLTKSFLNSLVQLFGDESDEMLVNGNF